MYESMETTKDQSIITRDGVLRSEYLTGVVADHGFWRCRLITWRADESGEEMEESWSYVKAF